MFVLEAISVHWQVLAKSTTLEFVMMQNGNSLRWQSFECQPLKKPPNFVKPGKKIC